MVKCICRLAKFVPLVNTQCSKWANMGTLEPCLEDFYICKIQNINRMKSAFSCEAKKNYLMFQALHPIPRWPFHQISTITTLTSISTIIK